jgi:ADP-heptose:LPS heptosyltransferase
MSLPWLFDTEADSIPSLVPYLQADSRRVEELERSLPARKPRVGIAWAGNPEHHADAERSVPVEAMQPLFADERVCAIVLQGGPRAREAPGSAFRSCATASLDGTAALMASVDLVIGVDSSIAHLAGALGRPVWLLLSSRPDWRWALERDRSPWYPTMRLFRQERPGDWSSSIARIRDALDNFTRSMLRGDA